MDFTNAKELLTLCSENKISISEAMLQRECALANISREDAIAKMRYSLGIMNKSAHAALGTARGNLGGMIGGEAALLNKAFGKTACGSLMKRGIMYAMGVLEVNANMGVIVAAPTAGSCGIVPGVLYTLCDEYKFTDEQLIMALFNAGAIGYFAMRNATVAGAVGGCQAEVGVASAMAASAAVELLGGTPEQCLEAASVVLMNMLGLVCDPVGGLVEYPCQNRNAAGVANALVAAEMSLAGIKQLIPFDEMLEIMYTVGKGLPSALRETGIGGCASSVSANAVCKACLAAKANQS